MAGPLRTALYLPLLFLSLTLVQGADLREAFYNQLRYILSRKPPLPDLRKEKLFVVEGWGDNLKSLLGQVTGVTVNPQGQPVILHRGNRIWDDSTFNHTHYYMKIDEGRIPNATVLTLDPDTGDILHAWGANMFYLPHSITIDNQGNTWITDVAMHQVLKFYRGSETNPTLRLGRLFEPGSDEYSLCKPTSVAVASSGEIFVSDGYCNRRILKYRPNGDLIRIFPHDSEFLSLMVPHSLTLMERQDLLCVADRENMRVVCFHSELDGSKPPGRRLPTFTIHQPDLGRVFAVASKGDLVYAVNGPTSSHIPIQGFTIDPVAEEIIDHWAPTGTKERFTSPHALAISPSGDALYVTEIEANRVWKFKFAMVVERNTP